MHRDLGHPSEASTISTRASLGIKVIGKVESCGAYIIGKAKQRHVNKTAEEFFAVPKESLYLNISSPNTDPSWKEHLLPIVDDATGYVKSYFLRYKIDLTNNVLGLIKKL